MDPQQSPKPLTRRERALVAHILAGRSNNAIAGALGTSPQTIRNQLTVLFRKLGVTSRLELAVKLGRCDSTNPDGSKV